MTTRGGDEGSAEAGEGGEPAAGGFAWGALLRGLRMVLSLPAALLFSTGLGFGALARDGGFDLTQTAVIAATLMALPSQVLLVDQLARNETLIATGFAVALSAVRLMPMTVTLLPLVRGRRPRPLLETLAVHFVAVSSWIEGLRRLPALPRERRLATYIGFGIAFSSASVAGTVAGYLLAGGVPAPVAAVLIFVAPIYFFLSLLVTAASRMDLLAVGIGFALAPVLFRLVPGFDLLITGLAGGTLAFLFGRRGRGGGRRGRP
jgi:predicted branched-subunit amino acid permease